ncbi:MAG: hypothetical protein HYU55_17565 [Nocardioides sp.]|nr:hypothetical protein [Nocardioides sp.]
MLNAFAIALAAEEHVNESVPNHWLVGGIVLVFLLVLLGGLLAFGAGREHS